MRSSANQRYWPRMVAAIPMSYSILPRVGWEDDANRWIGGGQAPEGAKFQRPDPLMDFSPHGLKFEDLEGCREGDLLIVEANLPGELSPWRMVARVVRTEGIPPRHRMTSTGNDPTRRVAVEFLAIEPGGAAALAALTERMQDFELNHRAFA